MPASIDAGWRRGNASAEHAGSRTSNMLRHRVFRASKQTPNEVSGPVRIPVLVEAKFGELAYDLPESDFSVISSAACDEGLKSIGNKSLVRMDGSTRTSGIAISWPNKRSGQNSIIRLAQEYRLCFLGHLESDQTQAIRVPSALLWRIGAIQGSSVTVASKRDHLLNTPL